MSCGLNTDETSMGVTKCRPRREYEGILLQEKGRQQNEKCCHSAQVEETAKRKKEVE
jgi:hypothetical protein